MYTLKYEFDNNIAVFKCNFCGHCNSCIESISYTNVKNRGCCWYFPKYTLIDIKNILSLGRKDFIYKLLNLKNSKISQYHISVIGKFDEEKFHEFSKNNPIEKSNFDTKLFFKLCPFATSKGCTINFSLRPHPCNLYLCRKVLSLCGDDYKNYSKERKDYYSYCNYFSESLKYLLINKKVDFLTSPFEAIDIIEKASIPNFSPRKLEPISFNFIPKGDDTIAG